MLPPLGSNEFDGFINGRALADRNPAHDVHSIGGFTVFGQNTEQSEKRRRLQKKEGDVARKSECFPSEFLADSRDC